MGNCLQKTTQCYGACCYPCNQYWDPELLASSKDDTEWSLTGEVFLAKVVSVYDGDTVRVKFRIKYGRPKQFVVRLLGYDAPELKPKKNSQYREAEKKAAIAARDALAEKIGNKMVWLTCGGWDKFRGRILGSVVYKGQNISDWMIQQGHGVKYDGGTKKPFTVGSSK